MDGPFPITKVQSHTVVNGKNGVPNTVSIHRTAAVLKPKTNKNSQRLGPAQQGDSTLTASKASCQQNSQVVENASDKECKPAKQSVAKIVGPKVHARRRRYNAWW